MKWLIAVVICGLLTGCGTEEAPDSETNVELPMQSSPKTENQELSTEEMLAQLGANHRATVRKHLGKFVEAHLAESGVTDLTPLKGHPLKILDLKGLEISDLSPLEGMPLEALYLEGTQVTDLTPLKGMPLTILYLNDTKVTDISPLKDLPLRELNLAGTQVEDISAVKDLPLDTLWLVETPVQDLSVLTEKQLESLDIQDTQISDLTPIRHMTRLQRLNIAGTPVTDLTTLSGLSLNRLIFTPDKITQGMDIVRNMPSLAGVGKTFEGVTRKEAFFAEWDKSQTRQPE